MLIELLLDMIQNIFTFLFGLLPNIPQVPTSITTPINTFFDFIFNNAGIIGVFVDINLIKVIVPLTILVINFNNIYKLFMWIIRKIPMLNIH